MRSCSNIFSRAHHLALKIVKLPYRATCWFCGRMVKIASSIKNCLVKAMSSHTPTVMESEVTVRVTDVYGRSCELHCKYSSPDFDPDIHNPLTGMRRDTMAPEAPKPICLESS